MKLKHIISGLAVILATVACTNDTFDVKEPQVTTDITSYVLDTPEAGSFDMVFHSNLPWEIKVTPANASSNVSDIKVNPSSGAGSERAITVTVTYKANKDLKREAIISITTKALGASVRLSQPGENDPTEVKGSLATPYMPYDLVADMMGGNIPSTDIYVRGIVSKVKEISTSYGNATFWLTDDGVQPDDDNKAFQVYRAKDYGLVNISREDLLKEGDVVTVFGGVTVYGGNTPETKQNAAQILAVNGVGTAYGDGSEELPYNVGAAMARILETGEISTEEVFVMGVIAQIKEVSPSYGNATYYITDDGYMPADPASVVQVFRGKWFGGESFTSEDQIQVGDAVVIKGTLVNYKGNTPEVNQGNVIVELNGKTDPNN